MNLTAAIVIFLGLLTDTFMVTAQTLKFNHLTTSDGLSHNTIYDIDQDERGFLWIATSEGLNRFDSYGFKHYYTDTTAHSIPSNDVRVLLITANDRLFVGTMKGLCLFNREHDHFTQIRYKGQDLGTINDLFETKRGLVIINSSTGSYVLNQTSESPNILPLEKNMLQIQEDSQGNLWSFKRQRLFCFTDKGSLLNTFYVRPSGFPASIPSPISHITVDSRGRLWIGTFKNGPVLFNPDKKTFKPLAQAKPFGKSHPMYFVRDIEEDKDGKYWIATENGLFIYDRAHKTFEHHLQSFDRTLYSINDNAIYKIFRSREDIMWLGTYFGGLNFVSPLETGFKVLLPGTKRHELKGKALSQIIKGPDDKLWIATEDAGVAMLDLETQTVSHILNEQAKRFDLIINNVHALTTDSDGNVWTGNFFGGINQIDGRTCKTIAKYAHTPGDPESLINNFVFSLYDDSPGLLWAGTMDGIDQFNKKTKKFSRFKPEVFRGKFIYDIFKDSTGLFWFGAYGDSGLYSYDRKTDKITHYKTDSSNNSQKNSFICHHIDTKGNLWFGTRGGGLVLLDRTTGKFKTYDMDSGLPNNVIYGILEDDHRNLWLSSNKGISKFNPETGKVQNFTVDHGLVGTQFNYKSYYKGPDGMMYFGAVNGLTYFHPDQIISYTSQPEVHFTGFRLFNEPVKPGAKKSVLQKDINSTAGITLKYNQNVISFDFIALDYYSKGKNNFYYFMDGFESEWQPAGHQQSATYTNLPPGDYTFHVKATNIYNQPNNKQRSIRITVLPPLWKTSWAYLFYTLFLGGIVLFLYRLSEIRHKEKMILKIEKIEKDNLRELHQHKLNFFTYISHEFKTPLTIILASLDAFFSGDDIPERYKNHIITLKRNVLRLQFLITQLMDFRKIETEHAATNLQYGDVIHFLKELFDAFSTLFKKKELEYIFISGDDDLHISFDPDKLEKIVSNLLSNAFKYTPEHGEITFKIDTIRKGTASWLSLTVSDTGKGMTEEQLEKIFCLFYKTEDTQNEYQGSGIGLTLTQSLVKLLNGKISVTSRPGEGTSFIVELPFDNSGDGIDSETIVLNKSLIDNFLIQSSLNESESEIRTENDKSDFLILFVEDNKDLLKFLLNHFKGKYKVSIAGNGAEAVRLIEKNVPDLIVTDLMMPEIDGISLCRKLKTAFEYSHIPVIMLTAKSDMESRIESLEVGADIYLPKPFMLSELELHIRNILASRNSLKKHFLQFGTLDVGHPIKNKDQHFIERIADAILRHLDDADFGVTELTRELGIGRTLLHTKLKQILDLSTTEFVNTIRIREAQKLLMSDPELTMSEIAYKVGFNDPNYFSRTFKKIFNVSPTDYRNVSGKREQRPNEV